MSEKNKIKDQYSFISTIGNSNSGSNILNYVFEAIFTECTHESSFETISIHRTIEGAQKAIVLHREMMRDELGRIPIYCKWGTRRTLIKE